MGRGERLENDKDNNASGATTDENATISVFRAGLLSSKKRVFILDLSNFLDILGII